MCEEAKYILRLNSAIKDTILNQVQQKLNLLQFKNTELSTYCEELERFENEQLALASESVKKELVHSIEGLFEVPDYMYLSVEQEVHSAIQEFIEQMRNHKILSSVTSQKVRKAEEVASVKRAFDYIDR